MDRIEESSGPDGNVTTELDLIWVGGGGDGEVIWAQLVEVVNDELWSNAGETIRVKCMCQVCHYALWAQNKVGL